MGRLLNKIKEPNDIKRISPKLYPILAQEIRDFLIDHVSQTGGHLASNLGRFFLASTRSFGISCRA